MSNSKAKALRSQINHLALELEQAKSKAETRCIKQAIRAAEFDLSGK